jgi:molecular chaperone GrpE (heat shock protein)
MTAPIVDDVADLDPASEDALGRLDEIADDVCGLLQSSRSAAAELAQLKAVLENTGRLQAIELDRMRNELLGQWKEMGVRSAFNAVATALDQLRAMHGGLDPEQDGRARGQIAAVMSSLRNALRGLGYEEYSVEPGAAFDAQKMEVVGYDSGPPGAVVRTARPGYRTRDAIAGVCGVILGETTSA